MRTGISRHRKDQPPARFTRRPVEKRPQLIVLGVILLLIGFIADISILWTIGIVLLVVGAVLAVLGGTGRKVGGRKHWF